MRLQVMSDLHIKQWMSGGGNYWAEEFPKKTQTDVDALILAGDIGALDLRNWRWSMDRLREFVVRYNHVIYVAGNHEFYGTGIAEVDLREVAQDAGLDVLYPGKEVVIDGQAFIGGTLFQPKPIEGYDPPAGEISDHWCIDDFEFEAEAHFRLMRDWLEQRLTSEHIVVTHHAPSNLSLAEQWIGDPCNRWFITPEMEPLIKARQPKLWIHGHTHTPFDYQIGKTRVVCNPLGYPNEGVRFNPKLVVEVP